MSCSQHFLKIAVVCINCFFESSLQPFLHFRMETFLASSSPVFDPLGRLTATAGSDHCFQMCPSVRPHFSKQNNSQAKTMFATGETVSLAEWIIDDT